MPHSSAKHRTRLASQFEDIRGGNHLFSDDEFLFLNPNEQSTGGTTSYASGASSSTHSYGAAKFAIANPAIAAEPTIEHPGKIGIGTWDIDGNGTAFHDLENFNFGWYYNWQAQPLWDPNGNSANDPRFVPMIWGKQNVTVADLDAAQSAVSNYVLGFNEPDNTTQADLTVTQALRLWPKLMTTDKLLGSPATTTSETLGDDSWLGRFMQRAEANGYDVDFVAVHYYSDDPSIAAFKSFLQDVRQEYDKPVWVTEWALVDWEHPDRFSSRQIANFAENGAQMMDDLNFVKRHAWFGAYSGGGGWDINTELIDSDGHLTKVGETFADLTL